ncbi:MAG: TonB-dependent receptor [Porphyromonas sp.]|nr:TonB-dependent receptor [Porphyromonas sp.]
MPRHYYIKTILAAILLLATCGWAAAANINFYRTEDDKDKAGAIKGTVIDKSNKEPLIGATVRVEGQSKGGVTDIDGNFQIEGVNAGEVTLIISYISYNTLKVEELVIKPNEITTIEVALDASAEELQEFVVTAKANRESENLLLLEQKQALMAVKAMGAMELSRKGISNAEAAVAQISGVSKQEGVKNVFVRGLGDRYNATYLNGFPIPSDDPEYKNIALDMFDTDMIQNISVQKSFSASQGGDVGGALIDITSKELYGKSALEIGFSGGANTSVLGNTFYKQDGTGYFGISNTAEPLEGSFSSTSLPAPGTEYPFPNKLQYSTVKTPIDHSINVSAGKQFLFDGNRNLSMFFVANHGVGYSHTERLSRALNPIGNFGQDLTGPNSVVSTRQMGLGNITFDANSKYIIQYNVLAIHSNEQYVALLSGIDSEKNQIDEGLVKMYRQQANNNLLLVNQLDTDWKLNDQFQLNAGISYNMMRAKEPDRRINYLYGEKVGDDIAWLPMGSDRNDRFFSKLTEDDLNAKFSLDWNFAENSFLRVGYIGRYVDHDFNAREYNHTSVNGAKPIMESEFDKMNWDELYYNTENMRVEGRRDGFVLVRGPLDWYYSKKNIHSAYMEVALPIMEKLSLQASLRADFVDFNVHQGQNETERNYSEIKKNYILPALNLKYDINDKNALRLSVSKTYTLPQVKEISPYQYINIGYVSFGNPNIKPSDLWNVDLKWDYYISPTELVSATAFYKNVKNPMARIDNNISSGAQEYTNPSDEVNIAGVEIELRKKLLDKTTLLSAKRHKLDLGISGSYIWSRMNLGQDPDNARNTMLEGSSPWLLNSDLTYTYIKGFRTYTAALVLSYFSDRIHTYGSRGITKSGNQNDLMEEGRTSLNLVTSAKLNNHLSIKFKANNLIDSPFRRTILPNNAEAGQSVVVSEYRKGISFSIGASWDF